MDVQGVTAELCALLSSAWDDRIRHDYRFWMSDGVVDDAEMWRIGERDLAALFPANQRASFSELEALEIGCGVGRMLRSAAGIFRRVTGADISQIAIDRARSLLNDLNNVSLVKTDGSSLEPVRAASMDLVYSFAVLANVPSPVLCELFIDMHRVLKVGGEARIQLYLGREQTTTLEDTLAIRSYEEERFRKFCIASGFEVRSVDQLVLPIETSDSEAGSSAYIVTLKKQPRLPQIKEALLPILLSSTERRGGSHWPGSATEYCMAVTRAQQHMDAGEVEPAIAALEFAVKSYRDPEPGVVELLQELRKLAGKVPQQTKSISEQARVVVPVARSAVSFSGEHYGKNIDLMKSRFREAAQIVESTTISNSIRVEANQAEERVIYWDGMPLDNVEKASRAAEMWVDKALSEPRIRNADLLIVIGCAGGYHLDALTKVLRNPIHLFEPNPEILKAAISTRDMRSTLGGLEAVHLTIDSIQNVLKRSNDLSNVEVLIHPQTQIVSRAGIDEVKKIFWSVRGMKELRPSIAVVGPIYGGSLPVAHSTARALVGLKQRTRMFDLNGFQQPYFDMTGFVRDKQRAGVLQSYYVEMLSQIVLEGISERPVDILISLAQAPLSPRVLTELRSRGIITVQWFVEDYQRFTAWKDIARYYDYMFVIQKGQTPAAVEAAGAGRAIYLPLACDPAMHRPMTLTAEEIEHWGSDISFVGAGYNNRTQMFASLAHRNFKIWGTEWPRLTPFDVLVQQNARRISPEEYVRIFNATKININLHSSMERDGVDPNGDFVNPRTFELAACGAFQLVDNRKYLPEHFIPEKEVATFSDRHDLEQKIDHYLAHPEERTQIAQAGRLRALQEHTYEQRMQQMLGYIYADRYEELRARVAQGPWERVLKTAEPYPELRNRLEAVYERGDDPKLENVVGDIQQGKGSLTETEQKLLFMHHIRSQITYVNELREGKS